MDREAIALVIVLSIAVLVIALAGLLSSVPFFSIFPALLFGGLLASTVVVSALFLSTFRIGAADVPPEAASASFRAALARTQWTVSEKRGALVVRLGRNAAAKILLRPAAGGTEVSYRADATVPGWGTVLTLILLIWTSFIAIPVAVYLFVRAWRFARHDLSPLLSTLRPGPVTVPAEEIGDMLIEGLSQAQRLAEDALEAERERYSSNLLLVVLMAFVLWAALFFASFLYPWGADGTRRLLSALAVSAAASGGIGAVALWALARRFRPIVQRYRSWVDTLRGARSRDAIRRIPDVTNGSVFELLASASEEVPLWLEAVRGAGMTREPGTYYLVFVMALFAAILLFSFPFSLANGYIASLILVGGVLLSVGAYATYRQWKGQRDEELAQEIGNWKRRLAEVRSRMERYVMDL